MRERAGVKYVKPVTVDPNFTDYGYALTRPFFRRFVASAVWSWRYGAIGWTTLCVGAAPKLLSISVDEALIWRKDAVLYKSFTEEQQSKLTTIPTVVNGWILCRNLLPNGYQFVAGRDYLLPIPPSELKLNRQMKQNPGWGEE